jgi:branched-chain amino acid transport system ATP-binding protein
MPLLETKGLSASLDGNRVLSDVSIALDEGEILAIMGANGSGKTTLLRAISGLIKLTSGEILFRGRRIDGLSPHEIVAIGVAQVSAGRKLFTTLRVIDNLELGATLPNGRRKRSETLDFVFSLFPVLSDKRNVTAGTLSGGGQQMLAIGRALMTVPSVLMLDEPTMGLAPDVAQIVYQTTLDISKKTGIAILVVDHDTQAVSHVADRGYVMSEGSVMALSSLRSVAVCDAAMHRSASAARRQ